MTIISTTCRSMASVAIAAALFTILAAGSATAQLGPCFCQKVIVDNNVNCPLTLVLQGASETQVTIPANSPGSFRCERGLKILVQDCRGQLHLLPLNGCVDVVLGDGCCARVCLVEFGEGCYRVIANPLPIDCPC